MIFTFLISFLVVVMVGLSVYGLYEIYETIKDDKRFKKELYDENKRMAESRLYHFRVNMLIDFMSWHNRMGLYETKEIVGPKYLKGMDIAFREIWKKHK